MRQLASRPDIKLRSAVTTATWRTFLTDSDSVLNQKAPKEYKEAITGQVEILPEGLLAADLGYLWAAGTGKTG